MILRRLLVVLALIGTTIVAGASAHTTTNQDPQDTEASPFDLRTVGLGHNSNELTGKAVTWGHYAKSELIPKGNTFYLDLDVDPDDQLDYYVSMFAKEGGSLVGKVYKRKAGTDPYKGSARVTRSAASNGDSVLSVEISRSLVGVSGSGQVIRYRWFSQYNGDTYDDAPNSGWYKLTI